MLGFEKLAKNARRFKMLMGTSLQEFDFLYPKMEKIYREEERERLSKWPPAARDRGRPQVRLEPAGPDAAVSALPQDVRHPRRGGGVFGVGQATVSRSMDQTAPILARCLPTPKLCARAKRMSTLEELEDLFPQLACLTDASEQGIPRPKRKDMEKSHFSGKAGTHTAKVQYATGAHGLIVHKTGHSPGSVHDVKVYKMKHPAFPTGLPCRDGAVGKVGRADLRHYLDRGYQGAQETDPEVDTTLSIRKKPGKKLTPVEKEFNKMHSKVRVYVKNAIRGVKTYRIMGDRYRNPLKKYDLTNSVVCELVNQRILLKTAAAA